MLFRSTAHKKPGQTVRFVTVLLPAADAAAQRVVASWRGGKLHVEINGKKYELK